MNETTNRYGQPVGNAIDSWQAPPAPAAVTLNGRFGRLEPLDADRHGPSLWRVWQQPDPGIPEDTDAGARWTYLGGRPFADEPGCLTWLAGMGAGSDPLAFAIVDTEGVALGMATYLRIDQANASLEIGHLNFSPRLARTALASEALMLLIDHAFALGYRRVEWKCDALNAASRRAAERLGFRFEGIFRQHRVVNGRNRDTAWFSIVDADWPARQAIHRAWLAPENFNIAGRQRRSLSTIAATLHESGD
ncbi:GNAT family N-acetyltransferase [Salinicola aestuarinus]|uniref:GNAT family N-acetyltransferase n=1 Tax=Salinicola aestuarinus TaxID=1949082 RepID=UPI000DA268E7|nr:GNAT family protein [Salinicola aestuarinus]